MHGCRELAVVAGLAVMVGHGPTVAGQNETGGASIDRVHAEISEAIEAIKGYSAKQRDEAAARAEDALAGLDMALERQQEKLRDNRAQMS